ncbi:HD-GYP domain-containing protein [Halalkalibaculum sp. DA384]|uniref:HD-GYP domain-containing protein n=1 Tax=Halalkalibaculum sp. DA384 TaxID=3373606 RepID=UPI003754FECE
MEEFDTERELEFWSLAAEHFSRKEPPRFTDIARWVDLIYRAPVHFVYKKTGEDTLQLTRFHTLDGNIERLLEQQNREPNEALVQKFEEKLEHIEDEIRWDDQFLSPGISSHSVGNCEHIPLYKNKNPWGIYCVGPQVKSPNHLKAKLPIVARILSNWMVERDAGQTSENRVYGAGVRQFTRREGLGTLDIERVAGLMLSYLANIKSAALGAIVELKSDEIQFLARYNVDSSLSHWFRSVVSDGDTLDEIKAKYENQSPVSADLHIAETVFKELHTEYRRAILFLGLSGPSGMNRSTESRIFGMLEELLGHRHQKLEITNKLLETYYTMLRTVEKRSEQTCHHTPRMVALAKHFGTLFGLEEEEQQQLQLTARLHDIGYIVTEQLAQQMTMETELEHPLIGGIIIDPLPLHEDVKEGVKTHHEWIDGTGTPAGLQGEEIPWTGKIIGLLEFVNEFIEAHQSDERRTGEEWTETLARKIIERAENQFDMLLVPTATELVRSLGWDACCNLGSDERE